MVLASCGSSGNGLDSSKKLVDLTPQEMMRLCEDAPQPAGLNSNGSVNCPGGTTGSDPTNVTLCLGFVWMPTCVATVEDANECDASLAAHPCDDSALSTFGCLMTQICANGLCPGACSHCTDSDRDQCNSACAAFATNFTRACATCLADLYGAPTCPDFTALPPPYDACASVCGNAADAGTDAG